MGVSMEKMSKEMRTVQRQKGKQLLRLRPRRYDGAVMMTEKLGRHLRQPPPRLQALGHDRQHIALERE